MPADLDRLKDVLGDRYALDRELGRGGMATVHLATDLKHDRQVAIKVLHPELSVTLGAERFLREIQIEARLNHPHILPLHDSGQADGFLYYVMPYVEGESLRDKLKRDGPLPVEEALQISKEVATALHYAHDQGLVHRDIKPENILLSAGQAVVADFGIARAVDEAGGEQLTATGMSLGTPAYMSPEQATGELEIDSKTDLYALGCVLYEMLTGDPPFSGPSPQAVMARKVSEPAPGLRDKREEVSEELEAVVLKALARTPEKRYETAGDFDQALTTGLPRAEWVREGRRSRAQRLSLGAAAVVLVAAGILWLTNPFGAGAAERAIAILPFEDVNPNTTSEWGFISQTMTGEIRTQLGKLADVTIKTGVPGDREKDPQEYGQQAGVFTVLYGDVTILGDHCRVDVQLVDTRNGVQVGAFAYENSLSNARPFEIHGDIADSVMTQLVRLGIVSSEPEPSHAIGEPTDNGEAWTAYLAGEASRPSVEHYEEAVELDPEFAWAWARLSAAQVDHLWYRLDTSQERRALAKEALDNAVALAPGDPIVLTAQAYYMDKVSRDYDRALELYAAASEGLPNDHVVSVNWAACYRRAGRWSESIDQWLRAINLNPSNARWWWELGLTYAGLGEFDKANEYYDESIDRGAAAQDLKAMTFWAMGRLDSARAILEAGDRRWGLQEGEREGVVPLTWFWQEYYEGKFEEAIRRLDMLEDSLVVWPGYHGPKSLYMGMAYQALGLPEAARQQYDSARRLLEGWLEIPAERNAARVHSDLGIVYAALGRAEEAIDAGVRAVEFHTNDAFWGPGYVKNLAFIYTLVGDYDSALDQIDYLLSVSSLFKVPKLQLDPRWEPLRDLPRYKEIIDRYGG